MHLAPSEYRHKTRVPGLSCGVVCVILRSAVLLQLRRVTDRRTDRRTRDDNKYRASIASRGGKRYLYNYSYPKICIFSVWAFSCTQVYVNKILRSGTKGYMPLHTPALRIVHSAALSSIAFQSRYQKKKADRRGGAVV